MWDHYFLAKGWTFLQYTWAICKSQNNEKSAKVFKLSWFPNFSINQKHCYQQSSSKNLQKSFLKFETLKIKFFNIVLEWWLYFTVIDISNDL